MQSDLIEALPLLDVANMTALLEDDEMSVAVAPSEALGSLKENVILVAHDDQAELAQLAIEKSSQLTEKILVNADPPQIFRRRKLLRLQADRKSTRLNSSHYS